jgi:hypothetical protein
VTSVADFCEHCQGQRFDRAQVLRALRRVRENLREKGRSRAADDALVLALNTIRSLEIPHLESPDDNAGGEVVH